MTTPTAPTPEELARTARSAITKELGGPCGYEIEDIIAAAISQHAAPLEAQIAELTAEVAARKDNARMWEDGCAAALRLGDEWKARATTAEAALADLIRLTGQTDAPKAVAVVATMLAGADHGSYGSVVRGYAECKAALSIAQERERVMREVLERIADPGGPKSRGLSFLEMRATARAALQPKEPANG